MGELLQGRQGANQNVPPSKLVGRVDTAQDIAPFITTMAAICSSLEQPLHRTVKIVWELLEDELEDLEHIDLRIHTTKNTHSYSYLIF